MMLAYSVSSKESLQSVNKWYAAVKASLSAHYKNPIGVVVGCKSDVRDGSVDSRAEVSTVEVSYLFVFLRALPLCSMLTPVRMGYDPLYQPVWSGVSVFINSSVLDKIVNQLVF